LEERAFLPGDQGSMDDINGVLFLNRHKSLDDNLNRLVQTELDWCQSKQFKFIGGLWLPEWLDSKEAEVPFQTVKSY